MAISNFVPEIWAANLLSALELIHVFGAVATRDYEGNISEAGDTVRIGMIGDPTIFDYTPNSDMPAVETLTDAQRVLTINQAKGFNFQVDNVDRAQAKPDVMPEAMKRAAWGLADKVDLYIAALQSEVATANIVSNAGSAWVIGTTYATAYEKLVDLKVALDNANVPADGRWVVVPPWFHGTLLKDARFVTAGTVPVDARLTGGSIGQTGPNGLVGYAAGFSVRISNNVVNTSGTDYRVMAGYGQTIAFAEQVNKTVAYTPEKRFGDAVKGLHLWGAKLLRPAGLAVLKVSP